MDDPASRRGAATGVATGRSSVRAGGRSHNAENARKAILDAAEEVFAEHGYDGARVDAIAARSGYNKSLIFQYFGDKLNLYAGVIRRADDQNRDLQNRMLEELLRDEDNLDAQKLADLLQTFVGGYFDFMLEHPNYVRILNWELAEGWQTYAKILTERDFQDANDFTGPLRKIEEGGFLRTKMNPMAQWVIALFINHTYLGIIPFFKVFLPEFDVQSAEGRDQAREFIIEFITHGLIAAPLDSKPQKAAP